MFIQTCLITFALIHMQPSMLADTLVKIFYLPVYVCLSRRLHYKKKKRRKKKAESNASLA